MPGARAALTVLWLSWTWGGKQHPKHQGRAGWPVGAWAGSGLEKEGSLESKHERPDGHGSRRERSQQREFCGKLRW